MTTTYTASQLAQAMGVKRQSMQGRLDSVPHTSQRAEGGNLAKAWSLGALPASLLVELRDMAKRDGFASIEHFLGRPGQLWRPPISICDIASHCLEKAEKLQKVMLPFLERTGSALISEAELEQRALEDYRHVFGFAVSPRHWHRLLKRTASRDRGAMNWHRVEIYLDENPARRIPQAAPDAAYAHFRHLNHFKEMMANPIAPDRQSVAWFWEKVFESYEEQLSTTKERRRVKRQLLDFLRECAPFLAKNAHTLKVLFNEKYKRWTESGRSVKALKDARVKLSGHHRAPELSEADRDKIISHAVFNCGGRVSQAWRELTENNALGENLSGHYLSNPSSKSTVPARIRDAVKHEVAMLEDIHHGPRRARLNGAYISRDWSEVMAMDWFCADDVTLPVYYFVPDGAGWFTLMRGQFLPMIDVRTTRILGYALQSERNYNARVIRTLITKVCEDHGLPRKGFYFEMGLWMKSRLLKGDANADGLSWNEAELGLREFGLRFVHSKLPRSKPIEMVAGALQNLMEGEPGYVGRNEQKEVFERVQKLMLQVKRREVDPTGLFHDENQWLARLDEICERYNRARQDGKMTTGLTPEDAFNQFRTAGDPPIKFDASCRYLFAHHKRPIKVTANGITLRFGKNIYNYRNADTGRLRGQTVLAWFNPEMPDVLNVTDLKRGQPFSVARSLDVPAMESPAELLEVEINRIEDHMAYAKARYRAIKPSVPHLFRQNLVDVGTVELGRQMAAKNETVQREQKQTLARVIKARKISGEVGLPVTESTLRRPESVEAMARLNELLSDDPPAEAAP
jgi:hypothetical protein